MTIRPMTSDDIPDISAWLVELPLMQRYRLSREAAHQQFATGLNRGDWLLVADTPETSACGFVWCLPQGAFGRSPYIRLIAVHPGFNGQGIGAALLDAAEARAAEIRADIFLLVSDFNTGAQRFYTRRGYEHVGLIPDYVVPGVSELLYRKKLR